MCRAPCEEVAIGIYCLVVMQQDPAAAATIVPPRHAHILPSVDPSTLHLGRLTAALADVTGHLATIITQIDMVSFVRLFFLS